MKLIFNIRPPNYVLTRNAGKYSLAELDELDFECYVKAYELELRANRARQLKEVRDDA